MKIFLTTLNAKYIHSSLALKYLEKYCQNDYYDLMVEEFTINDNLDKVTAVIYKSGADVVAFSCYIWNITFILEIADRLKKIKPDLKIILGGPEVSFETVNLMEENQFIDFVIKGEGEESFNKLLNTLAGKDMKFTEKDTELEKLNEQDYNKFRGIPGLVFRDSNRVISKNDELACITELNYIPRPYLREDLNDLTNKIVYYETSRGCPFHCSYCLSSVTPGVRYFSLERVKEDLLLFIKNKVDLVKFVDRTFNARKEWALEIFRFLVANRGEAEFHFEIAADLFDQEMIDFLKEVPVGLFRFEIGVQSTNLQTLRVINRVMDLDRVMGNIKKLRETGNINLHLDLIAGLPGEDYKSFARSFDRVYRLYPHEIQLGFLKLLKGTEIRAKARYYGYQYTTTPPYEVLKSNLLSVGEIIQLKEIDNVHDKYHNDGVFSKSLAFIINKFYRSPLQFFADLSEYFAERGLDRIAISRRDLYDILFNFYKSNINREVDNFSEFLKFDLLAHNRIPRLPYWAEEIEVYNLRDRRHHFLENKEYRARYFPELRDSANRKIMTLINFAAFRVDVLTEDYDSIEEKDKIYLFNYNNGRVYDVTEYL